MVVSELPSRRVLGLNHRTYERLKLALTLKLRHQILIAVCDDLNLRNRLIAQLADDFSQDNCSRNKGAMRGDDSAKSLTDSLDSRGSTFPVQPGAPQVVTLGLDVHGPGLRRQVWSTLQRSRQTIPNPTAQEWCLQIVGVEHLTRQSGAQQRQFLNSLQSIETLVNQLDCSLLIWLPWPWFRSIQQAAPEFWHCRTGVFEFAGEPTPMETEPLPDGQWLSTGTPPPALTFMQPAPQSPQIQTADRREHPQDEENLGLRPRPLSIRQKDLAPSRRIKRTQQQPLQAHRSQLWGDLASKSALTETGTGGERPNPIIYPAQSAKSAPDRDEPHPIQPQATLHEEAGKETGVVPPALAIASLNRQPATPPSPPLPSLIEAPLTERRPDSDSLVALRRAAPQQMPLEITLFQRIEQLTQQGTDTVVLANTYWALGQHYRDRVTAGESHAHLINAAIAAYEGAHQELPITAPGQSDLLNDLGSLYWLQAQQIEVPTEALSLLQKALVTYQKGTQYAAADPDALSRLHSNLAAVCSVLANHDQPEHYLKQAIAAYHKALQHLQAEAAPLEYASLQNSLGAIYWRLAQYGTARPYLDHAITAYLEARHHCQPHQDPGCYAMIQNNLGIAYWSLSQFQQPGLMLKQAIAAYHSALAYRTLAVDPIGCASTQNNLGTAYWELAKLQSESAHRQRKLWRRAIAAYQSALKAVQRLQTQQGGTSLLSFDPKTTHHSLAVLYRQLAENQELAGQTQSLHLARALTHALAAIAVASHTVLSVSDPALTTLAQTIRAHYQLLGLAGQQEALAQVPSALLPGLLAQL
ncbi:MAG: tetratricopeptide repeat protein [Cyanobacteria bacterium J06659_2]